MPPTKAVRAGGFKTRPRLRGKESTPLPFACANGPSPFCHFATFSPNGENLSSTPKGSRGQGATKSRPVMLDKAGKACIIKIKGAATSGQPVKEQSSIYFKRNRHFAEWRFLLFTIIVNVKLPIWNVIRMWLHPLSGGVADRLPLVQHQL